MNLLCSEFKRKFSVSMYKNLKIMLGEMSFFKDFINDTWGNLYPIIEKSDNCVENVENNQYIVTKGMAKRLFFQFFPFATYGPHNGSNYNWSYGNICCFEICSATEI